MRECLSSYVILKLDICPGVYKNCIRAIAGDSNQGAAERQIAYLGRYPQFRSTWDLSDLICTRKHLRSHAER